MAAFTATPPGAPKSNVLANGQAVNAGNILAGLTRDSQVQAHTGTATGDRGVQDFAKGQLYQNQANTGRDLTKLNAKINTERMGQREQMAQAWNQAQMNQYKSLSGQRSQQSTLAQRLLEEQIGLNSQWQTSAIGMMS
jgi:hypothetical protein